MSFSARIIIFALVVVAYCGLGVGDLWQRAEALGVKYGAEQ